LVGEILAVGTELLLGQIVDTNSAYLSRRLAEIGVDVFFKSCVGDNVRRVESTLQLALSRSDLVIMTGGLGPTDDDVTVSAVADVLGRKLVYSAEVNRDIVRYFRRLGRQPTDNNRKQAMVIEGCAIIRNEVGTAPGQIIEDAGKIVVLVPGVPREMTAMIEGSVIPYLKQKMQSAGGAVIRSRVLRVAGIGESALVAEIEDILSSQTNPTIAPYASDGLIDLRITAKAPDDASAQQMIDTVAQSIRDRLGTLIYGEGSETLAEVVGGLLSETGQTIALAESCTGGFLGKLITDVPGSSRYFLGGVVTYSNESKSKLLGVEPGTLDRYGAVSRQTAIAMALGVKRLFGSSVSVSVTGLAGPGGATASKPVGLVYGAVACNGSLSAVRLLLNGGRDQIRTRASIAVLNLLRRVLEASPSAGTGSGEGRSGDLRW
jgi:nicotinamide-nucleotide amidase